MKQIFILKIIDGLYIGDKLSPRSSQFLHSSKISLIINCAATQIIIPLIYKHDIKLFNYSWLDTQTQIILDQNNTIFNQIYQNIQKTFANLEGTLICSKRGQSRSLIIAIGYLMKKYKWSLYKTLQYINSKKSDLQLRSNFLSQLISLQIKLFQKNDRLCTCNWQSVQLQQDGNLLKNTYLNSLKKINQQNNIIQKKYEKKKRVKFSEFNVIINNSLKNKDYIKSYRLKQIQQLKKNNHIKYQSPPIINQSKNNISAQIDSILIKKQFKENIKKIKTEPTEQPEIVNFKIKSKNSFSKKIINSYRKRKNSQIFENPILIQQNNNKSFNDNLGCNKQSRLKQLRNLIFQKQGIYRKPTLNQQKLNCYLNELMPPKNIFLYKKRGVKAGKDLFFIQKQFRSSSTYGKRFQTQNKNFEVQQLYSNKVV